jgi:hypothetical protein
VSTWRKEGRQCTLAMRLSVWASRATPCSRRCAFSHVSSVSAAGGARLHRRAPGAAILARAATCDSRAAGSGDGNHGAPQPTRWLKAASAHMGILVVWGGDMWLARCRQFGRRYHAGNQRREDLGEEKADRQASSVSDDKQ